MKQFNYNISSIESVADILHSEEVAAFYNCQSQLIQIFSAINKAEWYLLLKNMIRKVFPSAVIVGASSVGEISSGKIFTGSTVILFSFFENSSLYMLSYECSPGNEEAVGKKLIKDVELLNLEPKGMLLLSTPISNDSGKLFNSITATDLAFPVFGGGAGDYANKRNTLVFDGINCYKQGVISVVFSGNSLCIEALTYLGYDPLSKEMTITDIGEMSVKTIDDKPAFSVYEKYLGIKADENFFQNCLEFPMLIYRNGRVITRVPFFVDEKDGSIQLVADVQVGEKFRIGYGNPQMIITESIHIQNKIREFQPEAIFLYTCICRRFLMQEEVDLETLPFNGIAPTAGFYTFGEFFADGVSKALLNSTMVAVGFREGIEETKVENIELITNKDTEKDTDPYTNQHTRILSRLLYFISVMTKELEEQNRVLESMNAEKDKFFSILAHDLRGPLSAFVAATQIINEDIQTMEMNEIKDITLSMKTSATNIYSLLENLLEWSRMIRGGLDFVPERLNLKEKIEACIDVLSESARKKHIDLTFSVPDKIDVFADNHMLDTVIRNLVSNALKFTPIGGKVSLTADLLSEHLVNIKINDTGIGMTPGLKSKLFMMSEKTSRRGTEGEASTGLGLLLCKEFIEKQGGKIWVESEVGKGSTFSFSIKQYKDMKN
jgi:signal transduction histidine kinase